MRQGIQFSGIFICFFVAKDQFCSAHYVYGIRSNKYGQMHIVRTSQILEIDREYMTLHTQNAHYILGEVITDPAEKAFYIALFRDSDLWHKDVELIGPPIEFTEH